jgi:hypothetical protein
LSLCRTCFTCVSTVRSVTERRDRHRPAVGEPRNSSSRCLLPVDLGSPQTRHMPGPEALRRDEGLPQTTRQSLVTCGSGQCSNRRATVVPATPLRICRPNRSAMTTDPPDDQRVAHFGQMAGGDAIWRGTRYSRVRAYCSFTRLWAFQPKRWRRAPIGCGCDVPTRETLRAFRALDLMYGWRRRNG